MSSLFSHLAYWIEGPVLTVVLWILAVSISLRAVFFSVATVTGFASRDHRWWLVLKVLFRACLPLHAGVRKKPVYTIIRYVFHACLLIVPFGLEAHMELWQAAGFNSLWQALPDTWADGLTLLLIAILIGLLLRRAFIERIRAAATPSNWAVLIVTALPFVSGFVKMHVAFSTDSLWTRHLLAIHVASGELLMLMALFLFVKTHIQDRFCTGCAACAMHCTTGALSHDENACCRSFNYVSFKCIACAACMRICPENAVELRHEINFSWLFQGLLKEKIRFVMVKLCEGCGNPVGPAPQVDRIFEKIHDPRIRYCPECKKYAYAQILHARDPISLESRINS